MNLRPIRHLSRSPLSLPALVAAPALAQGKFVYMTNWFAEAEHGGFYQAIATGLYKAAVSTSPSRWADRRSTSCS